MAGRASSLFCVRGRGFEVRAWFFPGAALAALSIGLSAAQAADAPVPSAPADETSQAADAPAAAAESRGIEAMVVTAQKRSENIQKVPVAVTAVTGEDLAARNLNDMESLKYVAPSVKFTNANSSRTEGFSIRGVGTVAFAEGIEQSVATVIDGVVMGRAGMSIGNFVDIERIEMLRGPQGMLFGKNASAGLISVVGNKPMLDEYSGSLHTSYGTDNDTMVNAIANLPISSDSALRIVGYGSHRDGYIENVHTGQDLNDRNQYGVKGKYLWKPTNDFSLYAIGDWSHTHANCCVWTTRENIPGTYTDTAQQADGIVPGPENDKVTLDGPVFSRSTSAGGSLEANWSPGAYTFTSISAYRQWRQDDGVDSDQTPNDYLNDNTGRQRQSQFSQELRVTSPLGGLVDYVAGLYYWHQSLRGISHQEGDSGALAGTPTGTRADVTADVKTENDSYAAFTQGTLHVNDDFRFIAGGRLTRDVMSVDFDRTSHGHFVLPPPYSSLNIVYTTPYAFSARTTNTNLSWKFGAQYNFTREVMGYATVSRGYKGPGLGAVLYIEPGQDPLVKPEIPTSYEVGLKSLLLGNRLMFNVAVFDTTFKDFQTQVLDASTVLAGGASAKVINASSLKTRGVEIDTMARPFEGLTLTGGVSYVDAYFGSGCTDCGGSIGDDTSGMRLPGSSRWTYTVAGTYEQPIFDTLTGFVSLNWYWRSGMQFSTQKDPVKAQKTYQSGYGLLGGNIGVGSDGGDWKVSIFAKNILDKRFSALILGTPVPTLAPGSLTGPSGYSQFLTSDAYRTVGVTADLSF